MSGAEELFELVTLPTGVRSVRSVANGQTFHPGVGPTAEAEAIHVAGPRLIARMRKVLGEGGEFVIWDVGLGAGANALVALGAWRAAEPRLPAGCVRLVSFDRSTAALRFACDHAAALGYPAGAETLLGDLLAAGSVRVPGEPECTWSLVRGDFPELLADGFAGNGPPAPHAIFYDPYSPAVNPQMWTLGVLECLCRRLDAARLCLVSTYSRSTAVRVTLLLAGFFVGIGAATGEKDETTVAANAMDLLDRPLDRRWLERTVAASANAAPLRAAGFSRDRISAEDFARLRAHAQFA